MSEAASSPGGSPAGAAAATAAPPASSSGGTDTLDRCLVYCRLRPDKKNEYQEGAFPLLTLDRGNVSVHDEKNYNFDGTFGQASKQGDVFESVSLPCVNHAINGFCSANLCYGQTGTGKSFTMMNTTPGLEGIVPQAATHLFDTIASQSAQREFVVEAQFVQIYRDNLGDLMSESGNARVDIHYDASTGVTLPGCSTHVLHNKEQFMTLFENGYKNRVTVATAMNPESSRGHAALVVWVSSKSKDEGSIEQKKGKITFIDLAGYERFSKTGISGADPIRKDEAKTINASLLSLGHVVTSLSNGDKHVPWRNSKLTRLLQDSIGGRSRTTIVLTVGPSSDHLFETTNTLQFGQRAMAVKVQAKVKVIVDWRKHALKLQELLDEKVSRIEELQQQLAGCVAAESELILRQQKDIDVLREKHALEMAELKMEDADDDRMKTLREQQKVEAELLYSQQAEERAYEEERIEDEEGEEKQRDQEERDETNQERGGDGDGDNDNDHHHQLPPAGGDNTSRSFFSNNDSFALDGTSHHFTDSFSPSAGRQRTKDELITELKKQVRLYRMRLLVPEKYRESSEFMEHQTLAASTSPTSTSHQEFGGGVTSSSSADVIPRVEYERMRKMLENEIDNRDQIIAQNLDMRSFAAMVPDSAVLGAAGGDGGKKDQQKPSSPATEQQGKKSGGGAAAAAADKKAAGGQQKDSKKKPAGQSGHSEADAATATQREAQVAAYVASLQRRITDLTERLDTETKNHETHHHHQQQQQQQQQLQKEEHQTTSAGAVTTSDDVTHIKTDLYKKWLLSFQDAVFDTRAAITSEAHDLLQSLHAEWKVITSHLFAENQYLTTELDTAKVEMSMALEGQNESLMEAIETARAESQAKFNVEKLSWQEDAEERLQQAVQQAVDAERNNNDEAVLMLQGEVAKLKGQLAEKESTIVMLNELQKDDEQEKQQTKVAAKSTEQTSSSSSPSLQQSAAAAAVSPTPTPQQQKQQQKMMDDIDSILMPVLKNKTQLLDDITEVLAATASSDFDHIPEIPLRSARDGFGGTTMSSASLDPHASLSAFIQQVRSRSEAPAHQQEAFDDDGDDNDVAAPPAAVPAAGGGGGGIPKLALGGLRRGGHQQQDANMPTSPATNNNPFSSRSIATSRRSLPASLPATVMRIIKRLRDSASESEQKWLKCVVALSKISKHASLLTAQQQQQQQGGKQQQQQPLLVNPTKVAVDVMNCVNAAMFTAGQQQPGGDVPSLASSFSQTQKTPKRGVNEAEAARRTLAGQVGVMQAVVAGEIGSAEQQALQSTIASQQEELARSDEEVVSLAVELARTKLQVRFERQLMLALGEGDGEGGATTGDDADAEARKQIAEFDQVVDEQKQTAQKELQQQQQQQGGDDHNQNIKSELTYYRLKAAMLEQKLRSQLSELAKLQSTVAAGRGGSSSSSSSSSATPQQQTKSTTTLKGKEIEQEIQREIHQASSSIVTDMDMITSCREAELRVLSARLEGVERDLNAYKKNRYGGGGGSGAAKTAPGALQQRERGASTAGGGGGGVSSSAESVFYHILRNLRKENSILHSNIRERGLQLRKFALTLMRHQLLPPNFDAAKLAGDVHSELRLAFAERDEEIFLKEQALNTRSTQVIVLEESLAALMAQLQSNNIVPCRTNSKFAAELQRAKEEMTGKIKAKAASREELKTKIERLKSDLEKLDQKVEALKQQQVAAGGGDMTGRGGQQQHSTARLSAAGGGQQQQSAINDQLLVLRLQKEHLAHTRNISEVQLGALESELSILQQSLLSASSTVAIEAAIENRDAEENASVMTRLFRKLGGGK